MSCHAVLAAHLDDYVTLVEQLFESFDPAVSGANALTPHSSSHAAATAAAAAAAAATAATSTDTIMTRLIRKDQLLQEAVAKLLAHQALHRSLREKWRKLAELDHELVGFCSKLGQLEHALMECSSAEPGLVKGLGGASLTSQPVRAVDVTLFAERLARMSFAPADHLERKAVLHDSVTRPPAPLEKLMAGSMLHLTAEEMQKLVEAEEQAQKEAEAAKKRGADGLSHQDMVDVDAATTHMPGSLAALGRQESLSTTTGAALPSFAELSAVGSGVASTSLWRQESAPRATAAPLALDLDLESSDSEDEDDD